VYLIKHVEKKGWKQAHEVFDDLKIEMKRGES